MKIVLAGNDGALCAEVLHLLKYPNRLCSYYYLSGERSRERDRIMPYTADGSEWIMDSGLFSLMFGSEQGTLKTFDDYKAYAEKYVAAMHSWGWKHAIVECDVQRVLGMDETFALREQVFDKSGMEVIYVWHVPEGEDGLRKLAAERKRIALSVPELRQVLGTGPTGGQKVTTALIHLLRICRESGPAKVHLLGCTEERMMKLPADSCDSTSWLSSSRFGKGFLYENGHLGGASIYSPKWRAWRKWCEEMHSDVFAALRASHQRDIAYETTCALACSAIAFKMFMENINANPTFTHPAHQLARRPEELRP